MTVGVIVYIIVASLEEMDMQTVFEIKVLETPTDELDQLIVDLEDDLEYVCEEVSLGHGGLATMDQLQNRLHIVRREVVNRKEMELTVREKYDALFA